MYLKHAAFIIHCNKLISIDLAVTKVSKTCMHYDLDGRVYVSFQDARVSEEQTETDVKTWRGG